MLSLQSSNRPLSFSPVVLLFLLVLSTTIQFADAADGGILCPAQSRRVGQSLQGKRIANWAEWTPYMHRPVSYLCLAGAEDAPPGINCGCYHGRIVCDTISERSAAWRIRAYVTCNGECHCPKSVAIIDSKPVDHSIPIGEQDPFWDDEPPATYKAPGDSSSSSSKQASSFWGLKGIFKKTRAQCGWHDCNGPSDCSGARDSTGCDKLICRVWEKTPGFFNDLGACYIPGSSTVMGGALSSLGGRSIDEGPCACNSTYISHQCCQSTDGMVWEAPEAKLGELSGKSL